MRLNRHKDRHDSLGDKSLLDGNTSLDVEEPILLELGKTGLETAARDILCVTLVCQHFPTKFSALFR